MYSKLLNKKSLIRKEKLAAQTGKNNSDIVKNVLLKIFAVTYERRSRNVRNKRQFAIFANLKRNC